MELKEGKIVANKEQNNENEITKELIDIRSNLENEVIHQIKL